MLSECARESRTDSPTVGHSKDMDTDGTYGHQMAGDLELAADYVEQAFDDVLKPKKTAEK